VALGCSSSVQQKANVSSGELGRRKIRGCVQTRTTLASTWGAILDPQTFADIHATLGEIDEAARWYRKALEDRSPDMAFVQVSSRLNPHLVGDSGFRAILQQMAFPTLSE
jgi:hypothetical protein